MVPTSPTAWQCTSGTGDLLKLSTALRMANDSGDENHIGSIHRIRTRTRIRIVQD